MGVEQVWFVFCDRCCDRPRSASHTMDTAIVIAQEEGYTRQPKRGRAPEWLCAVCTKNRNNERADTARKTLTRQE